MLIFPNVIQAGFYIKNSVMLVSFIIVLCDVCLFKKYPYKITFSHVCMLINTYLIVPN